MTVTHPSWKCGGFLSENQGQQGQWKDCTAIKIIEDVQTQEVDRASKQYDALLENSWKELALWTSEYQQFGVEILATIWLPKLEKDAFGSQTIQNDAIGKTVALQYFPIHRKTIKNGKISTRNEKVACSSQVTSSKIRDTPLGYPLF